MVNRVDLTDLAADQPRARRGELDKIVSSWTAAGPAHESMTDLQAVLVPAHQVQNTAESWQDPPVASLRLLRRSRTLLARQNVGSRAPVSVSHGRQRRFAGPDPPSTSTTGTCSAPSSATTEIALRILARRRFSTDHLVQEKAHRYSTAYRYRYPVDRFDRRQHGSAGRIAVVVGCAGGAVHWPRPRDGVGHQVV